MLCHFPWLRTAPKLYSKASGVLLASLCLSLASKFFFFFLEAPHPPTA